MISLSKLFGVPAQAESRGRGGRGRCAGNCTHSWCHREGALGRCGRIQATEICFCWRLFKARSAVDEKGVQLACFRYIKNYKGIKQHPFGRCKSVQKSTPKSICASKTLPKIAFSYCHPMVLSLLKGFLGAPPGPQNASPGLA